LNKLGGRGLGGWDALDAAISHSEISKNLSYLCMTQYDKLYELPVIIPPESLDNILASIIAQHQVN